MGRLLEAKGEVSAQELAAANERVREWLERRLATDSRDLARLYRHSRDEFAQKIRWIYDAYLGERPTYVAARATGALQRIYSQIDLEVQQLADEVGQRAVASVAEQLNELPEVTNRRLGKLARLDFKALPVTTQQVLGELTTSVVGGGTFFDRLFHVGEGLKTALTGELRTGLLGGETFDQVRDRIHKAFGVDKLAEPTGPAYGSVKHYKNEARRQWNALMQRTSRGAGGVSVWLAKMDAKTTPGCLARHGRRLDELNEIPPRHWNCRCEVGVFPEGAALEGLQAEGKRRLRAQGWFAEDAMLEEAQAPGWPWGRDRIVPALISARLLAARKNSPADERFIPLPWRQLPALSSGRLRVESSPLAEASGMDRPDCALLRPTAAGWEAKTWAGWAPLRLPGAPMIEVAAGWLPDGPGLGPPWDEARRRLPFEFLARWPAMGRVSFPAASTGAYAVALVSPQEAEAAALGQLGAEAVTWAEGDLEAALWGLMANRQLSRPHLLLAFPGEQPRLRLAADLETGQVLYADEPFGRGLAAPYRRAAAFVREPGGLVWAIRPRGLPFWSLPGGHLEPEESPAAAAVREAGEEAGLRVKPLRPVGTLYRPWSTTEVIACARVGLPGAPSSRDEIDAAAAVPFTALAADERAFLARHGQAAEA